MELRLSFVAEAAGGEQAGGDATVGGVSFDSRSAAAGDLFVPVMGAHSDGHDFVGQAVQAGAAAFLWERRRPLPEALEAVPHVLVEDSVRALQDSARAWRDRLSVRVVAVTGSNGKTSTKELVAAVSATVYRTAHSPGNANSQLGLPRAILELSPDVEVAVLEMGMTEPGQIARLCEIARPDVGIITMVGEAHLGYLGSRAAIARAKWELIAALKPGATAILPDDEPLLRGLPTPDGVRVVRFGETDDADVRMTGYAANGSAGGAVTLEGGERFFLPVPGRHQARNALAAIAAGDALRIPRERALAAFGGVRAADLHVTVARLSTHVTIINDAYNAAPSSVRAALDVLRDSGADVRVAVLGDMLELGPDSGRMHEEVGASARDIDHVFVCGSFAADYAKGVRGGAGLTRGSVVEVGTWEEIVDPLWDTLRSRESAGQSVAVLIKGSRSAGMERIAQALERRADHV